MEAETHATLKKDGKTANVPRRKRGSTTAPKVIPAEAGDLEKAEAWQKRLKAQYGKFKGLENRQKVVERARRAVYEYLVEVIHENIEHAKQGNSSVAKFLMNFAGIEQLPVPTAAASNRKKATKSCACTAREEAMNAARSFSEKLGVPFPRLKPPKAVDEALESEAVPAMSD